MVHNLNMDFELSLILGPFAFKIFGPVYLLHNLAGSMLTA